MHLIILTCCMNKPKYEAVHISYARDELLDSFYTSLIKISYDGRQDTFRKTDTSYNHAL